MRRYNSGSDAERGRHAPPIGIADLTDDPTIKHYDLLSHLIVLMRRNLSFPYKPWCPGSFELRQQCTFQPGSKRANEAVQIQSSIPLSIDNARISRSYDTFLHQKESAT